MQITMFSLGMGLLWTGLLIVIISLLCRSYRFVNLCSLSGIAAVYICCILRLLFPVEFPDTIELSFPAVYNRIFLFLTYRFPIYKTLEVSIYQLMFILWVVGMGILLVRLILRNSRMRRWLDCISEKYTEVTGKAIIRAKETGVLDEKIRIREGEDFLVPMCAGLRRPIILLPRVEMTEEE